MLDRLDLDWSSCVFFS